LLLIKFKILKFFLNEEKVSFIQERNQNSLIPFIRKIIEISPFFIIIYLRTYIIMVKVVFLHILLFIHYIVTYSLTNIPEHPKMSTHNTLQRHFIFGYGSLMCHRSRAVTAPSLAQKHSIPVVVEHLTRKWSARIHHKKEKHPEIHGQTAMGIELARNKKCSGVLIEVDRAELEYFDIREGGYDRVEIDLSHVWGLDDDEEKNDVVNVNTHPVLERASHKRNLPTGPNQDKNDDFDMIKVWVYIPRTSLPANQNFPIVQSYVDIILRGCLDYGTNFATYFLNTTDGWWNHEIISNIDDGQDLSHNCRDDNIRRELNHFNWVEDRDNPFYVRADMDWSKEKAELVDNYLEDHVPLALMKRKPLDRILGAVERYEEEFD
jgi:cation transport regulator ChaC